MSDTSRSRSFAARSAAHSSPRPPVHAPTHAPGHAPSHTASTPVQSGALPTPADGLPHALVDAALPLLRDWLPTRRWFAGKGRPIDRITPATVTPLPGSAPGDDGLLLHLLLEVEQRGNDGVDDGTGRDLYQLLLGARAQDTTGPAPTDPAPIAPPEEAVIGRITGGPHDGLLLFDGAYDQALTDRLLALLAGSHPQGPVRPGPLRFNRLGEPASLVRPDRRSSRVGSAEQSNTSIIFDDASILKLFRRVGPGLNPDLELSLALSRAGSTRVPTTLAWYEGDLPGGSGQPATLGLLQRYLRGAQDGWEFALSHVRRLREEQNPDQLTGNFSAESFLLGRSTAEIHLALARALPVTVLGRGEIQALADTMAMRLDAAALVVPALAPYRTPLHRIFRALAESAHSGRLLRAQRIHGDLHLGQSMRTGRGWVLLDFEGEPAKSLAERRRPQPAIRDVAAMLRSFDYAAAHLLAEVPADDPHRSRLARLAAVWANRNREAFCAGYAAAGAEDPTADPVLLHAMETDKAVYEVVYEARNRPEWLPIPLSAIARLSRTD